LDLEKEIKLAISTGKVIFGRNKTLKLLRNGKTKAIVVASNIPKDVESTLLHLSQLANVKVIRFNGNAVELGIACGKPFSVSMLAILDEGKSKILSG
jgi:large subunit ribosomal protein L30e